LAQALLDEAGIKIVDTLVTSDPPAADDYRAVAAKFFPLAKITALLPKMEATADELISQFEHAGAVEMSSQYSRRLVGTILADELNLPMSDLDKFKKWAEVTGELMAIGLSEEDEVRGVRKMMDLVHYLDLHLERAKEDARPGTVIRTIVDSTRRDGSQFSKEERSWMTFLTFTAANNTTVNMLNAVLGKLAQSPDLQYQLRDDPASIHNFIEEMLRLESSAQALARTVTRDVTIGSTKIPRGSVVLLSIGSANRDEARWGSDAAYLQVDRSDARKHLGFGCGRHQCIGMHLAKAEIRVTVKRFLSRLKNIRLADPAVPPLQLPLPFHRGVKDLHLRFEPNG
jgi:cytochrome P450